MAAGSKMEKMVQRPDWQKIRAQMIGTWNLKPEKNVAILRAWIGPMKTAEEEKLRITMNYLTGTGFRSGKIKHPSIQKLRDDISSELKRRKLEETKSTYK